MIRVRHLHFDVHLLAARKLRQNIEAAHFILRPPAIKRPILDHHKLRDRLPAVLPQDRIEQRLQAVAGILFPKQFAEYKIVFRL